MRRSFAILSGLLVGRATDSPPAKVKRIASPIGWEKTTSFGVSPSERTALPILLYVYPITTYSESGVNTIGDSSSANTLIFIESEPVQGVVAPASS